MTTQTILSEEALAEIEAREPETPYALGQPVVPLTPNERDALIHTVRALKAERDKWQQANAEAAREINCAGPVAHRIRILKKEHQEELAAMERERNEALDQCTELHREIAGLKQHVKDLVHDHEETIKHCEEYHD